MRLNEVRADLAHVSVIIDDDVATDGMLGEPGGDLVRPAGAVYADGGRPVNGKRAPSTSLRAR